MGKQCFKCQVTKPLSEFYRHKMMGDGHLNKCKLCTKLDVKDHRDENRDYYRDYDKSRSTLPHRVELRKQFASSERGKLSHYHGTRRYRERHPERHRAHVAVRTALRKGVLKKSACEVCGSSETQAHHHDYSKPLEVRWLCQKHHTTAHRQEA